jgi:hypothetical protein
MRSGQLNTVKLDIQAVNAFQDKYDDAANENIVVKLLAKLLLQEIEGQVLHTLFDGIGKQQGLTDLVQLDFDRAFFW